MKITLVIAILLSILVTIFALSNNYIVDVNFIFTEVKVAMPLLLLSTLAFGVLITLLFNIPTWWRHRKEKTSHTKQIASLKNELKEVRDEYFHAKNQQDIHQPPVDDFINDVEKE